MALESWEGGRRQKGEAAVGKKVCEEGGYAFTCNYGEEESSFEKSYYSFTVAVFILPFFTTISLLNPTSRLDSRH